MPMKKISFILIIALLISSFAYGSLDEIIGDHWSKGLIEESFVNKYLPYLGGDGFSEFSPDKPISVNNFSKSLNLLFKDYGYEVSPILNEDTLLRKEMVNILGDELINIGLLSNGNGDLPFKDINIMEKSNIDLLRLLYNLKIIQGDTNTQFSPERILSQAESVIILQRVRGVLDSMDIVSFKTLGLVQTFNGKEEITVIPQEDKVLVTITKQFPTPGYRMEVKNISKTKDEHKISLKIEGPPSDSEQLQVITYKTISLEIDKVGLGKMPYNFILEGYNKI